MSISKSSFRNGKLLKGALAGFISTGPMTAAMLIGWKLLPGSEKYPLPPRQITEEVTERLRVEDRLSDGQLTAGTLLSHFSYGALAGSIYGPLSGFIPLRPSVKGILAGILVWAGSYLGWLPAMRILSPATRHPWRRNSLMIVAHVVWGVTLGMVFKKLTTEQRYLQL